MPTRWSPLALHLFYLFLRPFMRRRLAGIYLHGLPQAVPENHAVFLVANHVSWWDGFLLREVHRRCVGDRPLYTVMLEAQLRRFPFFRWMGAIGMTPEEPASLLRVVRFLKAERQQQSALWVAFFPQGRIWPAWRRPLGFQPGLQLFTDAVRPAVVLAVGLHLEPLNQTKPSAFVSVGAPVVAGDDIAQVAEAAVTDELDRIQQLLHTHGEDAPPHWPGIQILR